LWTSYFPLDIGEEGASFVIGELDLMVNVSDSLGQVKGGEVEMGGDALVEGFIGCQFQDAAQLGLTDQEQDAQGLAVHVGGEKQAQGFEDLHR
jgi:hypothetical protein